MKSSFAMLFLRRLNNAVAAMQFRGKVPEDATKRNVEWVLTAQTEASRSFAKFVIVVH
jgi:hypothetical protein